MVPPSAIRFPSLGPGPDPSRVFILLAGTWEKRWKQSSWKESSGEAGKWEFTAGEWYGDAEKDKGESRDLFLVLVRGSAGCLAVSDLPVPSSLQV